MKRLTSTLTRTLTSTLTGQQRWLLAAALLTALSLLLVWAPTAQAEQPPAVAAKTLTEAQIYNDDLVVEKGQVIDRDVVVYDGDVTVEDKGEILGNLTVYSGDIKIEEGGRVHGNVTSWSGDVGVDGRVDGSISAMSGDIDLGNQSIVGGNLSVMAGDIKQRAGAAVGGSVLQGAELKLPALPALGALPWLQSSPPFESDQMRQAPVDRPWGFAGRFLGGFLLLGLLVGGVAAVMALRPAWVGQVQDAVTRQTALSFAVGLIANVLMLAIIGFLYITVCLRPPALLLGLGMFALNVVGMAAVGAEVGSRLRAQVNAQWSPIVQAVVGVLVIGAVLFLLNLFGSCLGFLGNLAALLTGSVGLGAVLVKVLNLGTGAVTPAASVAAPGEATVPPVAPVAPSGGDAAPYVPPAETAAVTPAAEPVAPAAPETPAASETPSVSEVPIAPDVPAAETRTGETAWWKDAPVPETPAEPTAATAVNFTRIEGIGPKLSQRLADANVRSFAELAALSPAALAGILGWSVERVEKSGILTQAQQLAAEQ